MSSSHVRCKCGHSEASSAPHCWNDQVQEGEVRAALFTSIHLPLLESVIDRLPSVSKYTLSVCARLRGGRCGKPRRPCIVYDVKTSDVCLMGTFEGCDPGRFPEVYRRFVVPVYPNLGKTPSDLHVHSCPRWESHHNQWILLVPFKPLVEDFQELPSWSSRKMTSRVHFDSEAMEVLRSLCREKQEEWEAEIHDKPTSLNQAHKEILVRASLKFLIVFTDL
ncbi:hypothetical protein B0H10DRAFT_458100 [Mycena sp. CBHHK59/15]|nr:hypothetical protein B0H10DRAFT_529175 [Mycena sp. CBHHK59/15]KAJ6626810.1 hypothetical protein B0H10DRAFT_458100 [Mycena sp. CBHHK59/15]